MASELTLQQLIERLHGLFASENVNIDEVKNTMETYQAKSTDWKKYANFDRHRYTRNLVDVGNGKFNLILLCWGEGHGSGIHDHSDAHCWMKVLDGSLSENLYAWPNKEQMKDAEHIKKMTPIRITEFHKNEVAYINDTIGLHRVENNSHTQQAASLHLYSPPFQMCQSFDDRTGKSIQCKVTFWSEFGTRTPFVSSILTNQS